MYTQSIIPSGVDDVVVEPIAIAGAVETDVAAVVGFADVFEFFLELCCGLACGRGGISEAPTEGKFRVG